MRCMAAGKADAFRNVCGRTVGMTSHWNHEIDNLSTNALCGLHQRLDSQLRHANTANLQHHTRQGWSADQMLF